MKHLITRTRSSCVQSWMLALALALPVALAMFAYHLSATTAWVGTFEVTITAALCACVLATIVAVARRASRVSIVIAALLLLAHGGLLIAMAAGVRLVPGPTPDLRFAAVFGAATIAGVVGLAMRRSWACGLCIAFGAAGILSGGLNAANFWNSSAVPMPDHMQLYVDLCHETWAFFVIATGGATIVINLVAARAAFPVRGAWAAPAPMMRGLRATVLASFAAVPMLLVYAWEQPHVHDMRGTAVVLAALLVLALVAALRGRVIGAVLLVVGGVGLATQTIAILALTPSRDIALYYAAFWTPAALASLVTGVMLAAPVWRLLRR